MFEEFKLPISAPELAKRTAREVIADDCLGLAAELGYYFLLALFPALLFVVALVSFMPVEGVLESITSLLARVLPRDALALIQEQILKIGDNKDGGLLTVGLLGTIWSASAGVSAIIGTLNKAYDIEEGRPWWKVKLVSLGLTVALAVFIVAATVLIIIGPGVIERLSAYANMDQAVALTWSYLRWPVALVLVAVALAMIYYFAPDAEQDWIWITPGSVIATLLWLIASVAFKFYVSNFGAYNATYGAIGGVIILMLWLYVSGLAVLVGAELNAEIEHASPYGKEPGEKVPGQKKKIGALARRLYEQRKREGTSSAPRPAPAVGPRSSLPALSPVMTRSASTPAHTRASDWILSGLVLGQAALLVYAKLRSRFGRLKA
jgi:membrane protein